jgi:hypothetical protein
VTRELALDDAERMVNGRKVEAIADLLELTHHLRKANAEQADIVKALVKRFDWCEVAAAMDES